MIRLCFCLLSGLLLAGRSSLGEEKVPESDPSITAPTAAQRLQTLPDDKPGLSSKTMGGSQFWSDLYFFRDWRIQRNHFSKSHRLLDRQNHRLASGTFEECREKLEQLRLSGDLPPMSGEAVILLHGILRSSHSFDPLQKALEAEGYWVFPVNYPSTRITIEKAAEDLDQVIASLEGIETIHIVGHSMGGLVTRAWYGLQQGKEERETRIGRIVMLGTPNGGAEMADLLRKFPPYYWLMGKAGLQLGTDPTGAGTTLPLPTDPVGIIAGGRGEETNGYNPLLKGDDDGTVRVVSTHLKGEADFYCYPQLHMLLMRDQRTVEAVKKFLKCGKFFPEAG